MANALINQLSKKYKVSVDKVEAIWKSLDKKLKGKYTLQDPEYLCYMKKLILKQIK